MLSVMSTALLLLAWESWEDFIHFELGVESLVGELVELSLVGLHLGDEVDEVLGLLKLLEVLGVNHISKLVFNLDN